MMILENLSAARWNRMVLMIEICKLVVRFIIITHYQGLLEKCLVFPINSSKFSKMNT